MFRNFLVFVSCLLLMGCGANSMRFIPPLTITREELDEGLAIFEHVVNVACDE